MLTAVPVPGKQKSRDMCDAFLAGAPRTAKGFVFYGVTSGNASEWNEARVSGQDIYYIDNSYFDKTRGLMFRVTRNRIQHSGLGESTGERFRLMNIPVLPWVAMRPDRGLQGGYTIIVRQSTPFMELVADQPIVRKGSPAYGSPSESWMRRAIRENAVGKIWELPWAAEKTSLGRRLKARLTDAGLTITHSSAAAVESLIAGVPVVVHPLSACYATVADTRAHLPTTRHHLFNVLADNQWTIAELKNGTAWKELSK